jgi:hypothetical protein
MFYGAIIVGDGECGWPDGFCGTGRVAMNRVSEKWTPAWHHVRKGGVQFLLEPGVGRRLDAGKKYKLSRFQSELACKIKDAENVDLYQTRPAGSRFVEISQFRARKREAHFRAVRAEFTKRRLDQVFRPSRVSCSAHADSEDQSPFRTRVSRIESPAPVPIPTRRRPVPVGCHRPGRLIHVGNSGFAGCRDRRWRLASQASNRFSLSAFIATNSRSSVCTDSMDCRCSSWSRWFCC